MCTNYSPAKVERLRVLLGLGPPIEYCLPAGDPEVFLARPQLRQHVQRWMRQPLVFHDAI